MRLKIAKMSVVIFALIVYGAVCLFQGDPNAIEPILVGILIFLLRLVVYVFGDYSYKNY